MDIDIGYFEDRDMAYRPERNEVQKEKPSLDFRINQLEDRMSILEEDLNSFSEYIERRLENLRLV